MPGGYSRDRWREMAELGLLALAVPEAAGGMGGSPIDLAIVAEALGNTIAPDPWLENGVFDAQGLRHIPGSVLVRRLGVPNQAQMQSIRQAIKVWLEIP